MISDMELNCLFNEGWTLISEVPFLLKNEKGITIDSEEFASSIARLKMGNQGFHTQRNFSKKIWTVDELQENFEEVIKDVENNKSVHYVEMDGKTFAICPFTDELKELYTKTCPLLNVKLFLSEMYELCKKYKLNTEVIIEHEDETGISKIEAEINGAWKIHDKNNAVTVTKIYEESLFSIKGDGSFTED